MAIVKTARPLQIGDEILTWADNDEYYDIWENKVQSAREELKSLPDGSKSITYLMKKSYKDKHSQNSKILYKRTVKSFDFKTGAPDYKDHMLKFNWGIIKTSNYEEIAYLEMHPEYFVRETNRELTPVEKQAKKIEELEAKLKALTELNQVNNEIKVQEKEPEIDMEEVIKEDKKVKINGSTRKAKTGKKRTNKGSNSK